MNRKTWLLLVLVIFAISFMPSRWWNRSSFSSLGKRCGGDKELKLGQLHQGIGRSYCVFHNFIQRSDLRNYSDVEDVTLALHSTAENLPYVRQFAENWDGPITLALVAGASDDHDFASNLLQNIAHFLRCHDAMRSKVSVHVVQLVGETSAANGSHECVLMDQSACLSDSECDSIDCSEPAMTELSLHFGSASRHFGDYPVNLARNVARHLLPTEYFLLTDTELGISRNFTRRVKPLLENELGKGDRRNVLVVRRFEISNEVSQPPRTKSQLKRLFEQGNAVEFHKEYYADGHHIPQLQEWLDLNTTDDTPYNVQLRSNYLVNGWEPHFVAHKSLPEHDSSFPIIRDNAELVYHMCRLNYTFSVLDDGFLTHPGIKKRSSWSYLYFRLVNIRHMQEKIKYFDAELDRRYPESKLTCPTFTS